MTHWPSLQVHYIADHVKINFKCCFILFQQVLDVSVFGDSGASTSSEVPAGGALVDDSVMSAMETQILPEVNEVVTLICVFAIFKVI